MRAWEGLYKKSILFVNAVDLACDASINGDGAGRQKTRGTEKGKVRIPQSSPPPSISALALPFPHPRLNTARQARSIWFPCFLSQRVVDRKKTFKTKTVHIEQYKQKAKMSFICSYWHRSTITGGKNFSATFCLHKRLDRTNLFFDTFSMQTFGAFIPKMPCGDGIV